MLAYHYCVFADHVLGTNGLADTTGRGEISGNDFLVAVGSNAVLDYWDAVPGTFMHELGHNLALRHGGADNLNRSPTTTA